MAAHQKIFNQFRVTSTELIQYLNLDLQTTSSNEFQDEEVEQALKNRQQELNRVRWSAPRNNVFYNNLLHVKKHVKLSKEEFSVFLFTCLLNKNPMLSEVLNALGELNHNRLLHALSLFLNIKKAVLAKVLATDATLHNSGLLQVDRSYEHCLTHKLDLLQGLSDNMEMLSLDFFDLFSDYFVASPKASLTTDHYLHLQTPFQHFLHYLNNCIKEQSKGVNILIYGPPGTGKTELSRVLADSLQVQLFEVAVENKRKDRISGVRRLNAYRLSQTILSEIGNALLVFDEMEDIDSSANDHSLENPAASSSGNKAWMNQVLENNPVPTIWITNDIHFLDRAHVRRFDYHLKMDIPPRAVRTKMLKEFTQDFNISEKWCEGMSEHPNLSPALMSRAVKVAKAIQLQDSSTHAEVLLYDVMSNAMQAMHYVIQPKKIKF